jgi:hypothetical protein
MGVGKTVYKGEVKTGVIAWSRVDLTRSEKADFTP